MNTCNGRSTANMRANEMVHQCTRANQIVRFQSISVYYHTWTYLAWWWFSIPTFVCVLIYLHVHTSKDWFFTRKKVIHPNNNHRCFCILTITRFSPASLTPLWGLSRSVDVSSYPCTTCAVPFACDVVDINRNCVLLCLDLCTCLGISARKLYGLHVSVPIFQLIVVCAIFLAMVSFYVCVHWRVYLGIMCKWIITLISHTCLLCTNACKNVI